MSGKGTYVYDFEQLNVLLNSTKTINENTIAAFNLSKSFFDNLVDTESWKGTSKDTFQAYYHLLLQYHGQLIGETVASIGTMNPVSVDGDPFREAHKALSDLFSNMYEFTDNCQAYKRLENT